MVKYKKHANKQSRKMSLGPQSKNTYKICGSLKLYSEDAETWVYIKPNMVGDIKYSVHTFDHSGWIKCDGRTLNKTDYTDLFDLIGTTYGEPSPTTFKLPDLRGRVIGNIGQGTGLTNRSSGTLIGAETHTLTIGEMPSHNHTINDPGHTHGYVNNVGDQNTDNAFASETAADQVDYNQTTGSSTTGITINNTGGGGAHNNMQPTAFIGNYFIFAKINEAYTQ